MAYPEPLPEHVLDGLTDEELIAYIAAMRSRGNAEAAATGLGVLVFGHWENVRRRVALRVPSVEVEDLTGEIIPSAVRSAFDGTSEGEFIVWLGTIVKRRIADFYRLRERRLDTDSLDAIAEGASRRRTARSTSAGTSRSRPSSSSCSRPGRRHTVASSRSWSSTTSRRVPPSPMSTA